MATLSDVYDLEEKAERDIVKGNLDGAIGYHTQACVKIKAVLAKLGREEDDDEFRARDTLQVLLRQTEARIGQLKAIKESRKTASKSKKTTAAAANSLTSKESREFIQKINAALIRHLNIDAQKDPAATKVPFVEQGKISILEHELQVQTFKQQLSSHQNRPSVGDLQRKNELLTQLNSYYYAELVRNHELVQEIAGAIRAVSSDDAVQTEENTSLRGIVGELQQRNAELQRNNLELEDEVVKLKKRWHDLVESARKRRDERNT